MDSDVPVDEPAAEPDSDMPTFGLEDHAASIIFQPSQPLVPGRTMDTLLGLRGLTGLQLCALVPPLALDERVCSMFRQEVVPLEARLAVLANEGLAMGDDEICLHIRACMQLSSRPNFHFLDPLIAGSWVTAGTHSHAVEWLSRFPDAQGIVTVVPVSQHWIPIVYTAGISDVQVAMWEHHEVAVDFLYPLHGMICSAWNRPLFTVACTRRSFAPGYCGASAVALVSHRLLGHALPATAEALIT